MYKTMKQKMQINNCSRIHRSERKRIENNGRGKGEKELVEKDEEIERRQAHRRKVQS
jgi:hypothetical protein